ncbi:hypothetical protein ABT224_38030 [Streptomyces sp. NPDC001584]|uniref:ATP-dependent DNA ligase n=1 Tax=Streptomyces sp. NPDC001584 TaxID=3154521 RepID=UPI003332F2F6
MMTDPAKAREWLQRWTDVAGVEGILIKSMSQRYLPGYRGWTNSAQQKRDGHRALLFTAAGPGGTVLVQTRRGALVQDRWPDLVAAAESRLPHGLVLDGELVVWDTGAERLSFEALRRRAATRARGAAGLAAPNAPVHHAQPFPAVWPAADRRFRHVQTASTGLATYRDPRKG